MLQVKIDDEQLATWAAAWASEYIPPVEDRHGKIESALVLDPYPLRGMDDLHVRTALMAPFNVGGRGASMWAGPTEAIRVWGAAEGSFTRRNTDVAKKPSKEDWERLYDPVAKRFLAERTGPKSKARYGLRLLRAPATMRSGIHPTNQSRTVTLLRSRKISNVMLPQSLIEARNRLRKLSIGQIRLIFALYALADIAMYGGVDANHACVLDGSFVMSDEFAYRIDARPAEVISELVGALSRYFVFVPAELEEVSVFPSARSHILYRGECDHPTSSSFLIRPRRWSYRREVQW